MKKRNFFHGMSLAGALLALICVMAPGSALAASKSVPTCNGWSDATKTTPAYCAVPGTDNICAGGVTLCTDVFGQANWANSPLPRGPIDISAKIGVTIVDMGSGYVSPVVTVTDMFLPSVTAPATCTAAVDNSEVLGAISEINCTNGGDGYMAPVVTITDSQCGGNGQPACGTGAQAIAQLSSTLAKTGTFTGGIRKFVDAMPDLKAFIPGYGLGNPGLHPIDTASFPGSDYYEIAVVQRKTKMHTDLPLTTMRGYVQVPAGSDSAATCSNAQASSTPYNYLGPIIVALKDRPVRIKFTNCLPKGADGNLFVPSDTTFMGAGVGPNGPIGTDCTDPANILKCYQENRATLHLHGGNSPWISDGTPHQWTVPYSDTAATYQKGVSTAYVPDMFFDSTGKLTAVPACSPPTLTTGCYPNDIPSGLSSNPGQGAMTFFWTNQESERLMMFHDHVQGITRINPYIGNAAGYLLLDLDQELALAKLNVPGTLSSAGNDLEHLIPLVIQDKGFVPSTDQLNAQDPTWIWGTGVSGGINGNGDLWFSHVYPPNQNPSDVSGSNAFGRWDYGVWFVPGQNTLTAAGTGPLGPNTAVTIPCTSAAFPGILLQPTDANKYQGGCPIIPNPSGTPESIMDTPIVNGVAYPVLSVKPEAYRFQILSVANDRSFNLQLYVADPTTATSWPNGSDGTEVRMVPATVPGAGNPIKLCGGINAPVNQGLGIGLVSAFMDASGNPLHGTGLLANCWPNYGKSLPSSQGVKQLQFMWPADGRDGGVPDPTTAGPAIIQIGTEGGLLPAPVVIPSTPSNYEVNMRSVTVTNISTHGLWLGTAERADAIIDFTLFAGKTLILYNDAPAPAPAFDMRLDYYTGDDDLTAIGGAPTTVLGYGPNTRTLMMIKVDLPASVPPRPKFNVAALLNGIPANPSATPPVLPVPGMPELFKAVQPAMVVPEPAYPVASGSNSPTTQFLTNFQSSDFSFSSSGAGVGSTVFGAVTVNNGGSGYTAATTVTIDPPAGCVAPTVCQAATASPTVVGGVITTIAVTNVGSGYTTIVPTVHIVPNGSGSGASATAVMASKAPLQLKAIQELFTLDYGRMNATLGTEIPFTNFTNQTTLPFGFIDWTTEIVQKDTPQLWYLYHNGVDTHFVHFHLFNVQVINRIGWDGSVRAIDPNEIGWKETVRMNPLENIVFAIKPITPTFPFPIPDSIRLQDPTKPDLTNPDPDISGLDPATGNAATNGQLNKLVNYGWEYVWHCHILGHEENDMMRPMIYQVPPDAPTNLGFDPTGKISWTDSSASETAFILQIAAAGDPLFTSPTPYTVTGANSTGFSKLGYGQTVTFNSAPSTCNSRYYRVQAQDAFTDKSPLAPHATQTYQTVAVSSPWTTSALLPPPSPSIITTTLPNGVVGTAYNATVTATGGSGTYSSWAITAGYPAWLSISDAGVLSGTPLNNTGSPYTITVQVTDSCGKTGSMNLSLTVYPPVVITTPATLPKGEISNASGNPAYAGATLAATGGNGSYTWAISGGALPLGLSLSSAGVISGTVGSSVAATTFTFTVRATSGTASATQSFSITVVSHVAISAPTMPVGVVNTLYPNTQLTATGGVSTYAWALAPGSTPLPAGLTLSATGVIGGTPSASGTFTPTVQATDSLPGVAGVTTRQLTITVGVPNAKVSPTTLGFGNQIIGTSSAAQTVTLSNPAPATVPLAISGFSTSGDYSQTNTCGATLAVGASCTVSVKFTPTVLGTRNGSLSIVTNNPITPTLTVSLTGAGISSGTAPGTPTGFVSTQGTLTGGVYVLPVGQTSVILGWAAPAAPNNTQTGYYIQRLVGGTWTTINTINTSTTVSFRLTGLTAGTTYTYRVQAFNSFGTTTGTPAQVQVQAR